LSFSSSDLGQPSSSSPLPRPSTRGVRSMKTQVAARDLAGDSRSFVYSTARPARQ
ncbi:unnamed protein product, partial [Citrullus colocynthis]